MRGENPFPHLMGEKRENSTRRSLERRKALIAVTPGRERNRKKKQRNISQKRNEEGYFCSLDRQGVRKKKKSSGQEG